MGHVILLGSPRYPTAAEFPGTERRIAPGIRTHGRVVQNFQVGIGSPAEMTSSRYAPVWGGDGSSWLSTSSWIR